MIKVVLRFFVFFPALCLISCTKQFAVPQDANWWYRCGIDYTGIESISDDSGNVYGRFNRNGTMSFNKTPYEEITYSYNADGSYREIRKVYPEDNGRTQTYKFEYDNKDLMVPMPDGPGYVSLLLVPNLSKVTIDDSEIGKIVVDFIFDGEKMTMTSTGVEGVTYNPLVIEYRNGYPYSFSRGNQVIGPITYRENGMFESCRTSYYQDGELLDTWTEYYVKDRNDKMLIERRERDSRGPYDKEYTHSETFYTYNEHGDCIYSKDSSGASSSTEYEYDFRGNWVKQTTTNRDSDGQVHTSYPNPYGGSTPNPYAYITLSRNIKYY